MPRNCFVGGIFVKKKIYVIKICYFIYHEIFVADYNFVNVFENLNEN